MNYYQKSSQEVLLELDSKDAGLSSTEAEKRSQRDGKNKLAEAKKVSIFKKFLDQIFDPMILILLIAAAVSSVTTIYHNMGVPKSERESFADVFVILFVVLLNAILGVIQEQKAEKAIDSLKKMTEAKTTVIRDGETKRIESVDLVRGDVILLEAGDNVPADCRIIESASLQVEESALTGESVPVHKSVEALSEKNKAVALGDQCNMAFLGSAITYGRGKAVVTSIGMATEMGKIAGVLTQAKEEKTPLQVKLAQLSKILTYLVCGICIFIFVFGMIKAGKLTFDVAINSFMIAVSLAVAAIPEGLAAVVTIVLSIGVTKMSKRNAVIRKLTAVETLGCTEVICSDKTGTLTQNKMTVVDCETKDKALLIKAMALASDATLDHENHVVGEPTECALVAFSFKEGFHKVKEEEKMPRVAEIPFDSLRKMMTTFHQTSDGIYQFTKGALDELLKRSTTVITNDGVVPLTDALKQEILQKNKAYADKALRVLGCAYKKCPKLPVNPTSEKDETELIFIGFVGMIDPIRPEVKQAIAECKSAGIRTIMITGDHKDTAIAIGKELGIITSEKEAITGMELDGLEGQALIDAVSKYSVYARVQPEHKVKIVTCLKKQDKIVAMTGDGVNDAPSIKSADIGIGMGITGTDVTKNVSDMILADDNFATIVAAVEEGRKVYDNIKKSIQFLLSSNLSEVITIFIATILGFTILKPTHLLWINLITDSLPALALGLEKGEDDIMKKEPRKSKEGIFSGGVGVDILIQGLLVGLLTLLAYFVGDFLQTGKWQLSQSADGMTMAFLTMSMTEIFHAFNMRSQTKSVFRLHYQNVYLFLAMGLAILLTLFVIYVPGISTIFGFTSISFKEYMISLGISLCIVPLVELQKLIKRLILKKKTVK